MRSCYTREFGSIFAGTESANNVHSSLSPYDDPYGALLYLDFTAPKCKQWAWFLDFIDELPTSLERSGHASHLQLDAYPGLWFAKALCRWQIETEEKDEVRCHFGEVLMYWST